MLFGMIGIFSRSNWIFSYVFFSYRKKATLTELSARLLRAPEKRPQERENMANFYLFCSQSPGPRRLEMVWTSELLNFFLLGTRWLDISNILVLNLLKLHHWIRDADVFSFFICDEN